MTFRGKRRDSPPNKVDHDLWTYLSAITNTHIICSSPQMMPLQSMNKYHKKRHSFLFLFCCCDASCKLGRFLIWSAPSAPVQESASFTGATTTDPTTFQLIYVMVSGCITLEFLNHCPSHCFCSISNIDGYYWQNDDDEFLSYMPGYFLLLHHMADIRIECGTEGQCVKDSYRTLCNLWMQSKLNGKVWLKLVPPASGRLVFKIV